MAVDMTHAKRISRDQITYVFGADQPPVADVSPGERVVFETLDAAGGRIRTHDDALRILLPHTRANPATGPVRIREAQPGDTLAVTVVDIHIDAVGYCRIKAGSGVIIDELRPPVANLIPVRDGVVAFNDRLRFPARPMIGVVGVAPAAGSVHTFYPGPHGGNLDINALGVGATVYLPVAAPGALLALGDVHASMGDGELTGGGIDINAEVTVQIELRRGLSWRRPVIETADAWCTCANGPTLAEAIRLATGDMATLLAQRLQMSREEAFILIGAAGDARIGQAAGLDIDATACVRIDKLILPAAF
ncbi:MAG: acetamidase/formamidase family protein [Chloroflexi bacterium]|nr:acetamidase/formamidase family protein [Chloroflexota bacterium]